MSPTFVLALVIEPASPIFIIVSALNFRIAIVVAVLALTLPMPETTTNSCLLLYSAMVKVFFAIVSVFIALTFFKKLTLKL